MIILPEDKAIISMLSPEDARNVFVALVSSEDDMPELSGQALIVLTVIKGRNKRISDKKSAAGRMGGAPENNQNAKKQAEQAEQAEAEKTSKTTHRTVSVPNRTEPDISTTTATARAREDDLPPGMRDGDVARIQDAFTKNIRCPSPIEVEELNSWLDTFDADVICYAIKQGALSAGRSYRIVETILRRWQEIGVRDITMAQSAQREWENQNKTRGSPLKPDSFMKSEYDKYNPEKRELLEDDPDEA